MHLWCRFSMILLVHCCCLSVDRILKLGTGWEPPICGSKMFEQLLRPYLTEFFLSFFAKWTWHTYFLAGIFFFGDQNKFSPPQIVCFLGVSALFQNWGTRLWEDIGTATSQFWIWSLKKMGQNGHSSPQQWSEQFAGAYMGLPPPTRWSRTLLQYGPYI